MLPFTSPQPSLGFMGLQQNRPGYWVCSDKLAVTKLHIFFCFYWVFVHLAFFFVIKLFINGFGFDTERNPSVRI